jgi:hypothetical protein
MLLTDLDLIRERIDKNLIKAKDVRIIRSNFKQTIEILDEFPNLEEMHCTSIILDINNFEYLLEAFKTHPKLTKLAFTLWSTDKLTREFCLRRDIPNLIKMLEARIRSCWLKFVILNNYNDYNNYTNIVLAGGHYYAENELFGECFKSLGNYVTGLTFNGDFEYDYPDYIREVTIIAKNNVNEANLKKVVVKADIVDVIYNAETINLRSVYSRIILTCTRLKRLKAIVPVNDADDHIVNNPELIEISIYVSNSVDVDMAVNIVNTYRYRYLTYNIYYVVDGPDYLTKLRKMGDDLVFNDLIFTLMNDRVRII